jgi:hypothetical protein
MTSESKTDDLSSCITIIDITVSAVGEIRPNYIGSGVNRFMKKVLRITQIQTQYLSLK